MRKEKDLVSEERSDEFQVFPGPQGAVGNEKLSRNSKRWIYSDRRNCPEALLDKKAYYNKIKNDNELGFGIEPGADISVPKIE